MRERWELCDLCAGLQTQAAARNVKVLRPQTPHATTRAGYSFLCRICNFDQQNFLPLSVASPLLSCSLPGPITEPVQSLPHNLLVLFWYFAIIIPIRLPLLLAKYLNDLNQLFQNVFKTSPHFKWHPLNLTSNEWTINYHSQGLAKLEPSLIFSNSQIGGLKYSFRWKTFSLMFRWMFS